MSVTAVIGSRGRMGAMLMERLEAAGRTARGADLPLTPAVLAAACAGADVALLCVPAAVLGDVAHLVAPHLETGAVLADIACSTHEQLQHLVELTGNEGGPILGCGGGFQSEALCQMLSDLSGRELRLRAGFRQATVQGLVTLCNDYLGEVPAKRDSALKTYHPRTGQLIHQYAPAWREARDRANDIKA